MWDFFTHADARRRKLERTAAMKAEREKVVNEAGDSLDDEDFSAGMKLGKRATMRMKIQLEGLWS